MHVDTEVTAVDRRDEHTGVVTSGFVVHNQRDDEVLVATQLLVAGRPG